MYSSRWYTLRSTAITTIRVPTPEKMAPATKNAPKIVLFQGSRSVMAKIQDTTVCTETAMGMIRIIAVVMAACMERHCTGVPRQRTDSRSYNHLLQADARPASRSRKRGRSGVIGRKREGTLAGRYVALGR